MVLPSLGWYYVALAVVVVGNVPSTKSLQSAKHSRLRLLHTLANSSAISHNSYYSTVYNVKDVQLGCKELRSKRYISDGYCTSVKPITEVVCAGVCLPVAELPYYAELVELRSRQRTSEWRCVNDSVRTKRVHLLCRSGDRRTYKIRVVRSCKCKKTQVNHRKTSKKSNEV